MKIFIRSIFGQSSDAVAGTDTGTFSLLALVKRGLASLTSIVTALTTANGLGADTTATGTITTQNLVPAGVATAGSAVEISTDGRPTVSVQVMGVYTGALSAQGTVDGTNWDTMIGFIKVGNGALGAVASAATGIYQLETAGFQKIRVTGLAAMTGTATISLRACVRMASISLDAPIPTGANVVGAVTQSGTWNTTGTPVTPTTSFINSAATTNATSTKASAGTVWSITATNSNAAARFLKLYNKASAPTVGTDVPVQTYAIPANGAPLLVSGSATGNRFSTGIALAITAAITDADTTAVAASEIKVAISYT